MLILEVLESIPTVMKTTGGRTGSALIIEFHEEWDVVGNEQTLYLVVRGEIE